MRPENIQFAVTGYIGYEEEVLRILNQNRSETQSRKYLDWRYLGESSPHTPIVFWVQDHTGQNIGMSSIIFRSYYLNGASRFIGIRGDTSLNYEYRGKGIGKKLNQYVKAYAEKEGILCIALANEAAARAAFSAGIKIEDSIVRYVYLLDITNKMNEKLKNGLISKIFGSIFAKMIQLRLHFSADNSIKFLTVKGFDSHFSDFWNEVAKEDLILRDRKKEVLDWRYVNHPHEKYIIFQILKNDDMLGFIICKISKNNHSISISDIFLSDAQYFRPVIKTFLRQMCKDYKATSVMILVNKKHPYSDAFKQNGFFLREAMGVLESLIPIASDSLKNCSWCITWGDKDI